MKRKIVSNFIYQASYQLLLVILPIITVPIVSRALGPSGVGTYNYISSNVSYFTLICGLGLANYGVREIAIARSNRYDCSKKFWELELYNVFFSLATFIVYIVFALFTKNKLLYLIQGMVVLGSLFDITWFFSGLEDFKKITIRNFVIRLLSFLAIILFIHDKDDLVLYFIIQSVSILLSQLSLWISIRKYVDWVPVTIKDIFSHTAPALQFFIAKIAMTLYTSATKTILGLMTTMVVVGYYSNSLTLVTLTGSIVNAMNTIMIPRMSHLFSLDDEEGMIKVLEKTIHLQLYLTIALTFGIIATNDKLIDWFFGSQFEAIKNVVPFVAPVLIFQSLQMAIAAQYLIPKKEMKDYNISVVIGAIISVIVNIVTIPFWGIYGAVAGILSGYITICVLRVKVLLYQTNFKFQWRQIGKYMISGLSMWGVIFLVTNNMKSSIYTTTLQVVIGGIVYISVSYIIKGNPIVLLFRRERK